jgi:hypothetical protein
MRLCWSNAAKAHASGRPRACAFLFARAVEPRCVWRRAGERQPHGAASAVVPASRRTHRFF